MSRLHSDTAVENEAVFILLRSSTLFPMKCHGKSWKVAENYVCRYEIAAQRNDRRQLPQCVRLTFLSYSKILFHSAFSVQVEFRAPVFR